MRLRYTRPAAEELTEILDGIASVSPTGARNVLRRIGQIERLISQFPDAGTVTRSAWLRQIVVSPYPYLLFYEIAAGEIVVHRIRHGARLRSE